ncbi:Flp family type IVb pilin [Alkalicoccus halolimnae]|uniref:Flp family type IVb pilin n=1 Tax=Alkalicoccus halolimnae TaxID=1667239 RepID=A0A5C7FMV2_9BACI|nr:Flp family type IVb pilin [Alkalicoccus halolimnae]TXF86095.1 Flp family type IVb pilin [Alkalicoccus halolimnae]
MMEKMKNLVVEEEGQGLVEYALIIALISVVLVGALQLVEGGISGAFNSIVSELGGAGEGGG